MTTSSLSSIRTTLRRIRAIWAELGYAQRRSLEIQTGLSLFGARER
jgi:hypothetical protein